MTFAEKAIAFYNQLHANIELPDSVEILNPYAQPAVQQIVSQFYQTYFSDTHSRVLVMGINPGRLGGGTTGISFTDPYALQAYCGINHSLKAKAELSSQFIYSCIEAYGGAKLFYQNFYLGALYPLALVKEGKNYNYYDSEEVYAVLKPFMMEALQQQESFGAKKDIICLGQKNYNYLLSINKQIQLFERIHVLEHPRFIMQYRRKELTKYIDKYLSVLEKAYFGL